MLNRFNHLPVILAGDWNATYSTENIEQNMDCFKMQRLPNLMHSRKINDLCAEYSLTDPFRFLYPEKLEYSYVPRNILANNKSRLDFFIISDSLLDCVSDCNIAPNLQNKLFDHRAISFTLNQNRTYKAQKSFRISNYSINDDLLRYLVHATVAETYLIHREVDPAVRQENILLLNTCGLIKNLIRECGPPFETRVGNIPEYSGSG
jgi:hypothetical protein